MDETSTQLVGETRRRVALRPGVPARYDDEDERHGTANVFMVCAPLRGKRQVTERRTKRDWAHLLEEVVDRQSPHARRITLVMDTLNTHPPASLDDAFEPAEAQRWLSRLACHDTPQPGSGLNMAEIELSVLSRQCLSRRIPTAPELTRAVAAWQQHRNVHATAVDWRFTTADARLKLKRLYPTIQH